MTAALTPPPDARILAGMPDTSPRRMFALTAYASDHLGLKVVDRRYVHATSQAEALDQAFDAHAALSAYHGPVQLNVTDLSVRV